MRPCVLIVINDRARTSYIARPQAGLSIVDLIGESIGIAAESAVQVLSGAASATDVTISSRSAYRVVNEPTNETGRSRCSGVIASLTDGSKASGNHSASAPSLRNQSTR